MSSAMTGQGASWPVLASDVRLGQARYRVIRPARPLAHALLFDNGYGIELEVDQDAAAQVAYGWAAASIHPAVIVYLPARRQLDEQWLAAHRDLSQDRPAGGPLDLVLTSHQLTLPPSRWRQIRQRLGAVTPDTLSLPAGVFDPAGIAEHRAMTHRGFRDYIRWAITAETLVLTGSRRAYQRDASALLDIATGGPAYVPRGERDHYCAEIHIGRIRPLAADTRGPGTRLHILYRTRF